MIHLQHNDVTGEVKEEFDGEYILLSKTELLLLLMTINELTTKVNSDSKNLPYVQNHTTELFNRISY